MRQTKKVPARHCEGIIAVEACVGMTFFAMLMLSLYTLIPLFMAQSIIGHALIESGESLALETYGTSKLDDGDMQIKDVPIEIVKLICGVHSAHSGGASEQTGAFANDARWFDFHGSPTPVDSQVVEAAKLRLAGYLAGSYQAADELLKTLGIERGMDGLDFTGTTLAGSDLIICVKYDISLLIRLDMLGIGTFHSQQSTCCRIWGSA